MQHGLSGRSPDSSIPDLARRAKLAAPALGLADTTSKDSALRAAADRLEADVADILAANVDDLARGRADGMAAGVLDRLRLDEGRVVGMASGLRQVAELDDPVGQTTAEWTRPNGLHMSKVRVPLGVVAIIYENRPNVTSDAFGLCLKSGNVAFLRGSSSHVPRFRVESGRGTTPQWPRGVVALGDFAVQPACNQLASLLL